VFPSGEAQYSGAFGPKGGILMRALVNAPPRVTDLNDLCLTFRIRERGARRISSLKRRLGEVGGMNPIPQVHCQPPTIEVKPKVFNLVTVIIEEEYGAHR
jgi:hypothetical protein